ncbi:hypothetical protein PP405_11520 [Mycobacteroides abscessus]|uniref:hypothetical protein n=1 Tax=Mycobacteroides abscessus TaxID=36809 RepID=UPI0009A58A07|nr:hypothetical protein [Mycobacteroides abscessus]MDM2104305.1 hypothetical protein [Mycobacteroides abscessus]MDM2133354.1 hypothetical protein [Mycobacteroides abscessus]MDM2145045.1 hypothetical protein [Mycobacteroides abscessus]MDM2153184.1 hypothetical protein [Mycobacteroides abscessus]MDM2182217.1 hypothetical protein [Mycobacteroides abscessus]
MTTTTKFPAAPRELGKGGRKLWNSTKSQGYILRPDEVRVLEDACREADLIDDIQSAWKAAKARDEFMVSGSMGQQVINPLVSELRQHRATLAGLLAKLKLPDTQAGSAGAESTRGDQQRAAANSRWSIKPEASA